MDIAIHLDRRSPPRGGIRLPDGNEIRFAGWLELLRALEAELEGVADIRPQAGEKGGSHTP